MAAISTAVMTMPVDVEKYVAAGGARRQSITVSEAMPHSTPRTAMPTTHCQWLVGTPGSASMSGANTAPSR